MRRRAKWGRFQIKYNRVGALLYTDTGRVSHARVFPNSPSHTVHEAYEFTVVACGAQCE